MLTQVYGNVKKENLLWMANEVMERFNNANFKTKSSNLLQKINRV